LLFVYIFWVISKILISLHSIRKQNTYRERIQNLSIYKSDVRKLPIKQVHSYTIFWDWKWRSRIMCSESASSRSTL